MKTILETTNEYETGDGGITDGVPGVERSGPVIPADSSTSGIPGIGTGTEAGESRAERCPVATAEAGQMELGLRSTGTGRPTRPVRGRRYVAARWWFAQMREAVRQTPEWNGGSGERRGGEQVLLSLPQPPTRFERRRAA